MNNVVLAVAVLIAASWAWGSVGVMERNYELQKQLDAKSREQQLVELETQTLKFEQRYYQSDEYKELAVRERLGLVMPGEKTLILPPNSPEVVEDDATIVQARTAIKPSNIELWTNFLFGGNSRQLQD